jgi:predicted naringenin-chalcone synthase
MNVSLLGLGTASPEHSILQDDLAAHVNRISFERSDSQKRLMKTLFRSTEIQSRGSVLLEPLNPAKPNDHPLTFYPAAQHANDRGPTTRERMDRYALEASPLAATAARRAFADAGIEASKITHLVTVSCTGFYAPGVDVSLIKTLNLSPEVGRLHIGFMGCHGALNGLRAAHAIAKSDPGATVLLCAVELCTLHFQYGWNRDQTRSSRTARRRC